MNKVFLTSWKIIDTLTASLFLLLSTYGLIVLGLGCLIEFLKKPTTDSVLYCFACLNPLFSFFLPVIFATISLLAVAIVSAEEICSHKLIKCVIIAGLGSGIILAIYIIYNGLFGRSSTNPSQLSSAIYFDCLLLYMVISAIVHIIQLLRFK